MCVNIADVLYYYTINYYVCLLNTYICVTQGLTELVKSYDASSYNCSADETSRCFLTWQLFLMKFISDEDHIISRDSYFQVFIKRWYVLYIGILKNLITGRYY